MTRKLIIATAAAILTVFSIGASAGQGNASYNQGILVANHDNRDNDNSNRQSDYDSNRGEERAEERHDRDKKDKKDGDHYKRTWYDPVGVFDRVRTHPWYDPLGLFTDKKND